MKKKFDHHIGTGIIKSVERGKITVTLITGDYSEVAWFAEDEIMSVY